MSTLIIPAAYHASTKSLPVPDILGTLTEKMAHETKDISGLLFISRGTAIVSMLPSRKIG
jgi:hypothetical protein